MYIIWKYIKDIYSLEENDLLNVMLQVDERNDWNVLIWEYKVYCIVLSIDYEKEIIIVFNPETNDKYNIEMNDDIIIFKRLNNDTIMNEMYNMDEVIEDNEIIQSLYYTKVMKNNEYYIFDKKEDNIIETILNNNKDNKTKILLEFENNEKIILNLDENVKLNDEYNNCYKNIKEYLLNKIKRKKINKTIDVNYVMKKLERQKEKIEIDNELKDMINELL